VIGSSGFREIDGYASSASRAQEAVGFRIRWFNSFPDPAEDSDRQTIAAVGQIGAMIRNEALARAGVRETCLS
jgi:hypothetical protein